MLLMSRSLGLRMAMDVVSMGVSVSASVGMARAGQTGSV